MLCRPEVELMEVPELFVFRCSLGFHLFLIIVCFSHLVWDDG